MKYKSLAEFISINEAINNLKNVSTLSELLKTLEEGLSIVFVEGNLNTKWRSDVSWTYKQLKTLIEKIYTDYSGPDFVDIDGIITKKDMYHYLEQVDILMNSHFISSLSDGCDYEQKTKIYESYHGIKLLICSYYNVYKRDCESET